MGDRRCETGPARVWESEKVAATIIHDNGRSRLLADRQRLIPNLGPVYCRLLERRIMKRHRDSGEFGTLPANLDLVLCSTRSNPQYTEKELDSLGITGYSVLGRHLAEWKHIYKIRLILEHIEHHHSPELLLHIDATDVLIAGPLQSAVDAFLDDGRCELLFGAEKGSAPGSATTRGITDEDRRFIERIENFEISTYEAPFRHLNAGCFIGRKLAIGELFSAALELRRSIPITTVLNNGNHLIDDDQLLLRELHRLHYPRIRIDDRCKVVQNLFAVRRSELNVDCPVPGGPSFVLESAKRLVSMVGAKVVRTIRRRS